MAGEFDVARRCVQEAMDAADRDPGMSTDAMASALLGTLLAQLLRSRSRKDVQSLVDFQLESCGEDEFVVTRGC